MRNQTSNTLTHQTDEGDSRRRRWEIVIPYQYHYYYWQESDKLVVNVASELLALQYKSVSCPTFQSESHSPTNNFRIYLI